MNESGASAASRGRRSSGGASAGLPESAADDRVAQLEQRLARLEGGPGLRDRGRKVIDRVVPPEATRHFRNAGREQLLGVRTIVDHWIRRIDDMDTRAGDDPGRETIQID
jgi:hypothetical protein